LAIFSRTELEPISTAAKVGMEGPPKEHNSPSACSSKPPILVLSEGRQLPGFF
jgi:hypothetical protein